MSQAKKEPLLFIAPIVIFLLVFCIFWQTKNFEFYNFDDDAYITQNNLVLNGFSIENALLAFQKSFGGHYHPLTWISHMIDVSLFGLNPGSSHLVNVLFHAINSILCFFLARILIKDNLLALFAAIIFAIHPMRLESVVWLSERKDVLSMSFGLSAILFYLKSKNNNVHRNIFFSLLFFILSLLSKPTFITLPFLLLILDAWSVQSFSLKNKIPYIFLSICFGIIALYTQNLDGGLKSFDAISISNRLTSSSVGYLIYFAKLFFPFGIGIFYPFRTYDPGVGAGAALSLFAITAFVFSKRNSLPNLFYGWIWFLISLLPMIGIVHIGGQGYADRWSYLPHIGLMIGITASVKNNFLFKKIFTKILILSFFIILTLINLPHWKNSISIFTHTLKVSPNNFMAHTNLGTALDMEGKLSEAAHHFEEAWRLNPTYPEALNNLGRLRASQSRFAEAEVFFTKAVERNPGFIVARYNLGLTQFELGNIIGATTQWLRVLEQNPNHNQSRQSMNFVFQNRLDSFCAELRQASQEQQSKVRDNIKKFFGEVVGQC